MGREERFCFCFKVLMKFISWVAMVVFTGKDFCRNTHYTREYNNRTQNQEHVVPTTLIGNIAQGKGTQRASDVTGALTDSRHTSRIKTVTVKQRNMIGGNVGYGGATHTYNDKAGQSNDRTVKRITHQQNRHRQGR